MLRECQSARVTDEEGMVVLSAEQEYVGGTRGSGIVSIAADMLGMSVGRGIRGVDGVCGMCMCLARGSVGGVGGVDERIGFGLHQFSGNKGVLDVCLCLGCGGVGGVGGE